MPGFAGPAAGTAIGELWFERPGAAVPRVLVKYLFTGTPVSVQVHPNADQSRALGLHCGKAECWYVVDAEEGAGIALGFQRQVSEQEVRAAIAHGTLPNLLAWRAVAPGDFIFVPGGMVHAIGAGLTIIELQQNCDVTFRLFDHGRTRSLQLEQALALADLSPAGEAHYLPGASEGDRILISIPEFTLVEATTDEGAKWMSGRQRWVLPVSGRVKSGGHSAGIGECLLLDPSEDIELAPGARVLVAAEGSFEA